jgi:CRISPR/Cas system-associated exonuclease Cas4 (RecB family)
MTSAPFLKEIAHILLQPGNYDLSSTCIVFPNKRARLYLSKYIGELTTKPVWAPAYLTISELMEKISGYSIADRLTLIFELYEAYSRVTVSRESFDSFYPYCETLLSDFDQIDKYMVNASDLFQNLAGLKSIDGRFNYLSDEQLAHIQRFWRTFSDEKISGSQELFVSLWEILPQVYSELRSRLADKKLAYEGMAYRKAVDENESLQLPDTVSKFVFIGFNALSTSEELLFRKLKSRGLAEFFWDYDSWYTNNDIHEAGFFIRKNLKSFPQLKPLDVDHLTAEKENVYFLPVASNTGQCAVLPGVFRLLGIKNGDQIENTALVLADEGLLLPALYALPGDISDINVTMGYPMGSSVVFSLIDSLYELYKNARPAKDGAGKFYYRDLLSLFSNPILNKKYQGLTDKIRGAAISSHSSYPDISDLLPGYEEDILFKYKPENVCHYLLEIFTSVIRDLPGDKKGGKPADPVQLELLFRAYTFLSRLDDVLKEQPVVPGPDALFRLIRKMVRTMHIPFSGEPLAGLQVLGILETRTIDFKNVIILSANEGVLPGSSENPSFIPYSLRTGFGMQTPEHQDAIYAYYFYRLIQRAENVAIIYDASSGGMKTGERSRFLHQLQYEMRLPVQEIHFESNIGQIGIKSIVIEKAGITDSLLRRYSEKALSPSAINEYFNCPVRYYFHHVAGLPQKEEVTSEVDARMFGTILHDTLKAIYSTFEKEVVTKEKIISLLKDDSLITGALDLAFSNALSGVKTDSIIREPEGYNLVIRQVILKYVRQFLKTEMKACPFTVHALEKPYYANLSLKVKGISVKINIGGTIDRIDQRDGVVRILDYKTGSVKDRFNCIESLFDGTENERNDAVFQVFLYSWVYEQLHPDERILPGLIFFRQSHDEDFSNSILMGKQPINDFSKVRDEFETLLKSGLEDLFNADLPFTQTPNLKTCKYCSYKLICRRE